MKDLFGEDIGEEYDDYKEYLKKHDNETLNDRVGSDNRSHHCGKALLNYN